MREELAYLLLIQMVEPALIHVFLLHLQEVISLFGLLQLATHILQIVVLLIRERRDGVPVVYLNKYVLELLDSGLHLDCQLGLLNPVFVDEEGTQFSILKLYSLPLVP